MNHNKNSTYTDDYFLRKLFLLKNNNYIDITTFNSVLNGYNKYLSSFSLKSQPSIIQTIEEKVHTSPKVKPTSNIRNIPKEKKEISLEDKRENNITLLLSLGVISIFLAGLIFSLSTWNTLSNLSKLFILLFVGTIFFGISTFCDKVFKVKKSSFAFWLLGSLFLPLSFIAIKQFGILGTLIPKSNSSYLYNAISAVICCPIFWYSYKKYKKSFYTYIVLACIDFIIINLTLSINLDILFSTFVIILFNVYLIHLNINNKIKLKVDLLKLILFNTYATSLILLINLSSNYAFFLNLIALSFVYLYLNYATECKQNTYIIATIISLSIGITGLINNLSNYFLASYVFIITPLILGLVIYPIINFVPNLNKGHKDLLSNFSLFYGLLSMILLSIIAPNLYTYKLVTIIILILNLLFLLYMYHKSVFTKDYISFLNISSVLFIYGLSTTLLFRNYNYSYQYPLIMLFIHISFLCLRKVDIMKPIINTTLSSTNIFIVFSIINNSRSIDSILVSLLIISIISCINFKINIYHKCNILLSAFSIYLIALLIPCSSINIFTNYNYPYYHPMLISIIMFSVIYVLQKKYKYNAHYNSIFIVLNNIWTLYLYASNYSNLSNTHSYTLLLVLFATYYLISYRINKLNYYVHLSLFNLFLMLMMLLINLPIESRLYVAFLVLLILIITILNLYNTIQNQILVKIITTLLFSSTLYVNITVTSICTLFMVIPMIIYIFSIKLKDTSMLYLCTGYVFLFAPKLLSNIITSNATLLLLTLILCILLRALGLIVFKSFYVDKNLDIFSIMSLSMLLSTINNLHYYEYSYPIFIFSLLSAFIVVELIRDSSHKDIILIIVQAMMSLGLFITSISLNISYIYINKLFILLLCLLLFKIKNSSYCNDKDLLSKAILKILLIWVYYDIFSVNSTLNNMFISSMLICLLFYGINKGNKKLVNISVINLGILFIFSSRFILVNLPWWIYLLSVGCLFVIIAIKMEKFKK